VLYLEEALKREINYGRIRRLFVMDHICYRDCGKVLCNSRYINRHCAVILVIEIWFAVVGSRIHILSVLTHMHYCWN